MTKNPRNEGWARALGCVYFSASMGLALAACSGGDDADEPAGGAEPSASQPAPAGDRSDDTTPGEPADTEEGSSNEGNPDVTGIDPGSPEGDGAEAETNTDTEASQTPPSPIEEADVPATEHCAAVADWDPEWVQFEEEVLELVNEFRSQPADCGVEGQFQAAPPLAMDPTLRCSARLHSADMYEREYFDHNNPDGLDPFDRMAEAGFQGQRMGENIAQGQPDPVEVMIDWMGSDGHCANIMLPEYTLIGIGFDAGSQEVFGDASNYWTQNFGTPFTQRRNR